MDPIQALVLIALAVIVAESCLQLRRQRRRANPLLPQIDALVVDERRRKEAA